MSESLNNTKNFRNGGMDSNSANEFIDPEDYIAGYNIRNNGSSDNVDGYTTNIESAELVGTAFTPAGITKGIGAAGFESIRQAIILKYNTSNNHQITLFDYDTNTETILYTDLTDSDNVQLLNFNPQYYAQIKLINDIYAVWTDGYSSIGFVNINSLKNGLYGTLLAEDFSLIKPQNLVPISAVYASDAGAASNFLKGQLFQFNSQYVNTEFNYSAYSTWSKRIVPDQESTPDVGTDVRVNNCIIITVNIGSIRVKTINIQARSGNNNFGTIKSVDRDYIITLPNTSIDIDTEVLEAYNPTDNTYSFVFYNDTLIIPVPPTDTDSPYDHVPQIANAVENINNNIIALGGITEGYERPTTSVTVSAIGYDPNITVPIDTEPNPIHVSYTFPGSSGSGAGDHKRIMRVEYQGVPHTDDVLIIVTSDIRNSSATQTYPYTVPSGLDGNLEQVVRAFGQTIPYSGIYTPDGGTTWGIQFIGDPYYGLQSATVQLHNGGVSISRSIHAILDNASYQLAISYRDVYGRYFPLRTDNSFIVKTPSYAQLSGNTPQIVLTINDEDAPQGAVDYQILLTINSAASKILDVLANPIDYKGTWNAHLNTPTLAPNSGTIGDTYQIVEPSQPDDHRNLGNGEIPFNTGDFVVYNGQTWDIVSKQFGDLTSTDTLMAFKINPLNLFNQQYANSDTDTVLSYDFASGDRCTLHYYIDGSDKIYFSDPCINVQVLGYDSGSFLVKMEKSSDVNIDDFVGKDVFLRLYTPQKNTPADSSTQNETIFYEIGERYTITNGKHDTLSINITDGDVYYKTRVYQGAVDPNTVYEVFATDFNFSDFYASAYTSYGRPRTYNDELERTERKASIRYSENYILGSKNNGLTKFFAENIYGDADGQTSSNYGAIMVLWQRNNELVVIQEYKVGYVPINISIIEDQVELKQIAISEKILNNIRYNQTGNIGIGTAKESFCYWHNTAYFVDPNRSEPIRCGLDGVVPISGKMSQFFKMVLQAAYAQGKKIIGYYNVFYNEYVLGIESSSGNLVAIKFDPSLWNVYDSYVIAPSDITPANGSHCTVSYDDTSGIATYTPTTDYVGNDVGVISFDVDGDTITKNVCLSWTGGSDVVEQFNFIALVNQPLSTLVYSNVILVFGNTIPAAISITGGEYSINGGSWVSTLGTVNVNDSVQVRQTTSASNSTETIATLTIDGKSADFSATTLASGSVHATPHVTLSSDPLIYNVTVTLTGTLSVDIDVDVFVVFNGVLTRHVTVTVTMGNTSGMNTTIAPHYDHPTIDESIDSVTPNPAGGITVTY